MIGALISGLNSIAGLLSMLIVFFVAIFAGKAMSKSKINEEANNAQQRTIDAMKDEIASLRRNIEDAKHDNSRLRRVIDTIRIALERRGLIITISDDSIDIEDNKRSTTIRIHNEELSA